MAMMLLAGPGTATAAILINDAVQDWTGVGPNGAGGGDGTLPTTTSSSFTVTTGASVLVVQYDGFGDNAPDVVPTITWDGQTLSLAGSQTDNHGASSNYADIFYLYNPLAALGNPSSASSVLTITGSGRSYAIGAFTLSNVDTSVAPTSAGAYNGASVTVTTSSSTVAGSFAAVAESARPTASQSFTLSSISGSATQQWNWWDNNAAELGGGVVSNLSAGASTVTNALSLSQASRNSMVVAVFAPKLLMPFVWTGSVSTSWDKSTANWSGAGAVYTEPDSRGVVFDNSNTSGNTNINIASVVQPLSVTFNNGALAYAFSARRSPAQAPSLSALRRAA